jgi:hypothetical protein
VQKGNEHNARYTCQAGRILPGKWTSCPGIAAKVAILDETVLQADQPLGRGAAHAAVAARGGAPGAQREEAKLKDLQSQLQSRLCKLDGQFLHWAEMAASQQITPEQFKRFNAKMVEDQKQATDKLAEVQGQLAGRHKREAQAAQVQTLVGQFSSVWRHLVLEEKREVLRQLLERLSLDKAPDGKTPLLTIKVHLLPAQTVPVVQASVYPRRKAATRGVAA